MAASCAMLMLVMIQGVLTMSAQGIGVNWGNIASHPLNPDIVVRMLKDNGIQKVKLFDADSWTLSTLVGTNMEVMVGIPNDQLSTLAQDLGAAKDWVRENVTAYLRSGGVNIKYVAVGNEPFLTSYNGSFLKTTFPALKNIQKALDEAGIGDKIKATIPQNADVYESQSDLPSDGNFRSDIRDLMLQIVRFFKDNSCPFTVNIYPFLSLYQDTSFPLDFAFFDGRGRDKIDKGVKYDNVFDANFDTLIWSLKKARSDDLHIIVGEVGWPTDGHFAATVALADRFYLGLFKKLFANEGTPLRPGKLDVYLFGLLDEDMKSILPGYFERHWGIFRFDGQPKFPLDFTGKGRRTMPVAAKGVQYLDRQWCVIDKEGADMEKLGAEIDYACYHGDCSSLVWGSSCSKLDQLGNASYAFNSYFQMQNQNVEACNFNGLARMTNTNASQGSCLFPLQIVSGCYNNLKFSFAYTLMIILVGVIHVLGLI